MLRRTMFIALIYQNISEISTIVYDLDYEELLSLLIT